MNLKQQQSAVTRQKFIDAAYSLFEEKGYAETSMHAIAERAGFTRSNLYLHFANKPDIVRAQLLIRESEFHHAFAALFDRPERTPEHVRAWLEDMKALWERLHVEFDAMQQAMTTDDALSTAWLAMVHRLADQVPVLAGSAQLRQDWVALVMGLDRNFFFLLVRNNRTREELVMQALTRQWLTLSGR